MVDTSNPDFKSCTIICSNNYPELHDKLSNTIEDIFGNEASIIDEVFGEGRDSGDSSKPTIKVLDCTELKDLESCLADSYLIFLIGEPESQYYKQARDRVLNWYYKQVKQDLPALVTIIPQKHVVDIYPPIDREICLELAEANFLHTTLKVFHDLNSLWSGSKLISTDLADFINCLCGKRVQLFSLEGNLGKDLAKLALPFINSNSIFAVLAFDQSQEMNIEILSSFAEALRKACPEEAEVYLTDTGMGGLSLDWPVRLTIFYTS